MATNRACACITAKCLECLSADSECMWSIISVANKQNMNKSDSPVFSSTGYGLELKMHSQKTTSQ